MSLRARFRVDMKVSFDGQPATIAKISDGGYHVHVQVEGSNTCTCVSESEARKRIRRDGEDPRNLLTDKQRAFLDELETSGGARYISGAEVGIARKLRDAGFLKLTDDGLGPIINGRVDGERWSVDLIEEKSLARCAAASEHEEKSS